ncbi:hypothetical protein EON80_29525 [bacterium]|nr:MAG: hypothetical protein EON80_29525 [bacterium]
MTYERGLLAKHAKHDLQLFPVKVAFNDGVTTEFTLFNIVTLVDAIDLENSQYEDSALGVRNYRILRLKDDGMNGAALARPSAFKPLILVSGDLKEAFEKHKVKGARFSTTRVAGYSPD